MLILRLKTFLQSNQAKGTGVGIFGNVEYSIVYVQEMTSYITNHTFWHEPHSDQSLLI
jgi:hypothetical protein